MIKMLKPLPTIGVSKYTIFKLKEDSRGTGTATYDTEKIVSLPGTVEITPTDAGGTDTFDADNGPYFVDSYIEKMGHDIVNADIPAEVDAFLRGLELKDGGVEVGGILNPPDFGVAWEVLKAGGVKRFVRYYKGKYGFASNVGGKTKASEGASEKQTAKASFTAVNRDCDEKAYYYIDSNNLPEGVTIEDVENNWFTDLNWYPSDKIGGE
ncbi:MAG: hypothetical protein GX921_08180 [Bacteroidales bacterium]|nr:hypothetical protein [Bacteroidales bacterium]